MNFKFKTIPITHITAQSHPSLLRSFSSSATDLHLQFMPPINIWKKCIDLRLFWKCLVWPFLRPLRSKDVRCWIFRLQPRTFVIFSESLAANFQKDRQSFVWQTVPKVWFICLFYCSSKTYSCKYIMQKERYQSQINQNFETIFHRGLPYLFEVGSQIFRNDYKFLRS